MVIRTEKGLKFKEKIYILWKFYNFYNFNFESLKFKLTLYLLFNILKEILSYSHTFSIKKVIKWNPFY